MEIELDLSRRCIETEIRRQYNRALSGYFRADRSARERLERIIALTRLALESLDFNHLRSTFPPLAGRSGAGVRLTEKNGRAVITLDGEVVWPEG